MADEDIENTSQTTNGGSNHVEEDDIRYCWVCFATDEDDTSVAWVQPCNCRGTTKWVHQACIQRWVDEKQRGNLSGKVSCPQCNTQYIIVFPHMGPVIVMLDAVDNIMYKVSPFVAAGIVVGSVYWTAVTYGAVTVMQVVGHKEGLSVMEQADPLVLLVGLPTIPVMLVLGKMVRWEDSVLAFLRRNSNKVPFLKYLFPSCGEERITSMDLPPLSDPVSATRILCSALLLPTVSTLCGRLFFDSVPSSLQRTILGGVAFITIKGALKMYHKQQQYVRQCQRRILDFTDSNINAFGNNGDDVQPGSSDQ